MRNSQGKSRIALKVFTTLMLTLAMLLSPACIADDSHAADTSEERVEAILSQMSTEEKVAQMMIVAMPATKAASVQEKYQFGGYILFARDFNKTNKSGMKKMLKSCQKSSKIPMIIGTDEEGSSL